MEVWKKIEGFENYKSKLTKEDVLNIRESNLSKRELSKKYNINIRSIYKVISYQTYKND
jgi:predicted transcriptional regulator